MVVDALLQDGNNHAAVEKADALCRATVAIGWGTPKRMDIRDLVFKTRRVASLEVSQQSQA